VRLLLVLFGIFLPCIVTTHAEPVPGRGVGGWLMPDQMAEVRASWMHQWNLCTVSGGWHWFPESCVGVVKNPAQHTEDQVREELAFCGSGWVMFGDEWTLQGWTIEEQAAALKWFANIASDYDCRVAFGGHLTRHPDLGLNLAWMQQVRDEYLALCPDVERVPVDAIVVDHYLWNGDLEQWETDAQAARAEATRVFGNVELWAREAGCLESHHGALLAAENVDRIEDHFDRWAWFISSGIDWTALWVDGELTDIGSAYQ